MNMSRIRISTCPQDAEMRLTIGVALLFANLALLLVAR